MVYETLSQLKHRRGRSVWPDNRSLTDTLSMVWKNIEAQDGRSVPCVSGLSQGFEVRMCSPSTVRYQGTLEGLGIRRNPPPGIETCKSISDTPSPHISSSQPVLPASRRLSPRSMRSALRTRFRTRPVERQIRVRRQTRRDASIRRPQ